MLGNQSYKEAYDYYRGMYSRVTAEDIESFAQVGTSWVASPLRTEYWHIRFSSIFQVVFLLQYYRESEEEKNDILAYYNKYHGNMKKLFDCVMLSR